MDTPGIIPEAERQSPRPSATLRMRAGEAVNPSQAALQQAIEAARERFAKQWNVVSKAPIYVSAATPAERAACSSGLFHLRAAATVREG
jgi:hypothetical protein